MENKTVDNKDNIDNNTDKLVDECPICKEKFDYDDKLPKKLTCCNNIICLDCLIQINNREGNNFQCIFCTQKITKRPIDIKSDNKILKKLKIGKELECLYCKKKEDFINFFYDEEEKQIKCKKCFKIKKKKILD